MEGHTRRTLVFAALMLALVAPSVARADDNAETAAQLFRTASAAFDRREYRAAAIGFEEASRRVPNAAALYNAALAWSAAGEKARAADALHAALGAPGLTPDKERDVRKRLEPLEAELARVRVEGPAGARVGLAHVQGGALPALIHLVPGEYDVTVERADGAREAKHLTALAGQERTVTFVAPPARIPPTFHAPPPAPTGPPADPSRGRAQRIAGWIGLGAGAVAGGVAVGLGLSALHARDEYENSKNGKTWALYNRAANLRTSTNVVAAGAGVLGAAGVVLLLTAPSPAKSALRTSEIRIGAGSVGWEFRF